MATDTKIGTHSGTFHADECFACVLLQFLPEYKRSQIIRTREPDVLSKCDVVVDVGGVFEPQKMKFDHHQNGFNETLFTNDIKLSSAGLVYKFFGKKILKMIFSLITDEDLNIVFYKIYKCFVEEIDAIDNGIPQCDDDSKMKYQIMSVTYEPRMERRKFLPKHKVFTGNELSSNRIFAMRK